LVEQQHIATNIEFCPDGYWRSTQSDGISYPERGKEACFAVQDSSLFRHGNDCIPIRVNAVAPGLIDTELHAANGAPDRVERMTPVQRPGTAEEVAAGVVWLLSDAASYVNGTVMENQRRTLR
jgi:hypothetical protein